ncbi:cation:proton antiporter [Streptomyces sp. NPDC019990]|uniref:cation:proton antiporter domain-containing protein n=1 Tax=Streptomyces sp. NPDC019990 TaxID=3154693 RepID=UPI0033E31902
MRRILSVYSITVLVPIAAVVALLVTRGAGGPANPATGHTSDGVGGPLFQLFIAASVVIAAAALGGTVARRLGQPAVVGELLAGFALGPSLLGALAPGVQHALFPASVLPQLDLLAQLGVVFFMFLVGAEMPSGLLRKSSRAGLVIGHASIAIPFLIGVAMALWLHGRYPSAGASLTAYLLFIGLSFAITALPVLARILAERRMLHSPLGVTGMAAAGIGDATAWSLLVAVIAIVRGTSLTSALLAVVYVTAFVLVMMAVVRPLLARTVRWAERRPSYRDAVSAGLICLILVSALATDRMGVHTIFGAFMAGAVMPRESPLFREIAGKIQGVTVWVMLPLFFATVGLRTELSTLVGWGAWLTCLAIVAVAVVAKVGSATVTALALGGHTRREALALGAMMNCRGLTELIVLNLGVQLGVLSPALFAMFVCMAVVTTAMTGPLLRWITPPPPPTAKDERAPLSPAKEDLHAPLLS